MISPRLLTFLLGILVLSLLPARADAQSAAILDARWADLASPDDGKAMRALLALAAAPKETVALMKERLKPVKADAKQVEQLLKQLDSGNFAVRSQAMMELEYLHKYIKNELERALKNNPQVETRARVQQLLDKLPKDPKAAAVPPPKFRPGSSVAVSNVNGQIQIIIDGVPLDLSKMQTPPPHRRVRRCNGCVRSAPSRCWSISARRKRVTFCKRSRQARRTPCRPWPRSQRWSD